MGKRIVALPVFLASFLVLFISIYKTASVKYVFSQEPSPAPLLYVEKIDYALPKDTITPENPFWPARAVVDRLHTHLTFSNLSKAELLLEDADLRLSAALEMYERGKIEESFVVIAKAEGYLMESYKMAKDGESPEEKEVFLYKVSQAALKHREVLEMLLVMAPEDGRAVVSRFLDTPKLVYDQSSADLRDFGLKPISNPF